MIDDLDKTIRDLLSLDMPSVRSGQVDVSFHQPNRDWKRDKAALNFFLYDVRQNPTLRQHQWREMLDDQQRPMRQNHNVPLQRTPLRIDCFYMVTAWSNEPFDEHRLLTECLVTLARYPVLNRYERDELPAGRHGNGANGGGQGGNNGSTATSAGQPNPELRRSNLQRPPVRNYLVDSLRDLNYEIPTRLAEHDVLTNPADVWGSVENSMKAAFSYVVTLPILPWLPVETPEVETATFVFGPASTKIDTDPNTGQPQGPATLQRIAGAEQNLSQQTDRWPISGDQLLAIGGLVRDALHNNEPVADIEVHIKDTGLYTRTDTNGRFRFPHLWLSQGQITLVVDPRATHPTEKQVRVPLGKNEYYEITINIVQ